MEEVYDKEIVQSKWVFYNIYFEKNSTLFTKYFKAIYFDFVFFYLQICHQKNYATRVQVGCF